MANKKKKITVGGNINPNNGNNTIIITQAKRFFLDQGKFMNAITSAENVDYTRRTELYDMYDDILIDGHLQSVIEKRVTSAQCIEIEFRRNGKPDEQINEMLRSPWFFDFIKDIMDAQFWGFSLFQFYKDDKGWLNYTLIPRKNVDPVRQLIVHRQGEITGVPWNTYRDVLFVGKPRSLGKLACACPYVIFKRNDMADWAQFCEIFGMPIREYTYDAEDDEAREKILEDARNEGGAATFIHPSGSELKLLESSGKSGSADLYNKLLDVCNNELSKIFLGNTLTTEASERGTQSLGTVQEKGEKKINEADKNYILNILNYEMTDIFQSMGYNVAGGRFEYVKPKETNITTITDVIQKMRAMGTPVSDDTVYELTGIPKPDNYDDLKAEIDERRQANIQTQQQMQQQPKTPEQKKQEKEENMFRSFYNHIASFFAKAPSRKNGALEW